MGLPAGSSAEVGLSAEALAEVDLSTEALAELGLSTEALAEVDACSAPSLWRSLSASLDVRSAARRAALPSISIRAWTTSRRCFPRRPARSSTTARPCASPFQERSRLAGCKRTRPTSQARERTG